MSDDPSSLSARRGSVLLEQGRYPDAEKFFREALAGDPNDAYVLYQLAVCELNQDRDAAALETIGRAT
ncbi:MAG TPA: tetratricopeptide repeat protein, partial [Chthoniobacterales bacterium]